MSVDHTAYEAPGLGDTSACSATAALIMAGILTVCWPALLLILLAIYLEPLTYFCLDRRG